MKRYINPLLQAFSAIALIGVIFIQDKKIRHHKFEIESLKKSIGNIDSAASKQLDELEYCKNQYDSLYSEHWSLKTYIDIKEGRAEE